MKSYLLFVGFLFLIIGCNQSSTESSEQYMADMIGPKEEAIRDVRIEKNTEFINEEILNQQPELIEKKIIKDGNMGIKVDNLAKAKSKIDTLLIKYKAYYANENLSNSNYESTYALRIRIPSKNFESLITDLESGEYELLYKDIDARDVTEEFIDLETRLENKRNYLKKYNELLKQAKSISEILEIEERIRNIEEEVESTEGRLKYLGDLVSFSTLNLNITQDKDFRFQPKKHHNFLEKLKQSFSNGWYAFITFFLFLIKLWPFWIIIGIGVWIWKKHRKKRKEKRNNPD